MDSGPLGVRLEQGGGSGVISIPSGVHILFSISCMPFCYCCTCWPWFDLRPLL